mmetsp:Transcript_4939/g.11510  ORF Transcript_4939/g.11510 Transcript_4939/m.11510 type:complete len:309 (-) Transcript_4939:36-962(-)
MGRIQGSPRVLQPRAGEPRLQARQEVRRDDPWLDDDNRVRNGLRAAVCVHGLRAAPGVHRNHRIPDYPKENRKGHHCRRADNLHGNLLRRVPPLLLGPPQGPGGDPRVGRVCDDVYQQELVAQRGPSLAIPRHLHARGHRHMVDNDLDCRGGRRGLLHGKELWEDEAERGDWHHHLPQQDGGGVLWGSRAVVCVHDDGGEADAVAHMVADGPCVRLHDLVAGASGRLDGVSVQEGRGGQGHGQRAARAWGPARQGGQLSADGHACVLFRQVYITVGQGIGDSKVVSTMDWHRMLPPFALGTLQPLGGH